MDIINELKLGNLETNFQDAMNYIEEQKELLEKKSHIFKVIRLANMIEKLNKDGLFSSHKITSINMCHYYNNFNGNYIRFEFFNDEQEVESRIDGKYIEPYIETTEYFDNLDGFDEKYISNEDFETEITLKGNIKKQIFSVLLSQELQTILDYSEMQIELENKKTIDVSKKIKM